MTILIHKITIKLWYKQLPVVENQLVDQLAIILDTLHQKILVSLVSYFKQGALYILG